jgi:hypothetical protein
MWSPTYNRISYDDCTGNRMSQAIYVYINRERSNNITEEIGNILELN